MNPNQKLRDGNHGGEGKEDGNMAFYGAEVVFKRSVTGRRVCVL